MDENVSSPLQYIKGIGPRRVQVLNQMGIKTPLDALYYFPRRYQDRTAVTPVAMAQIGQVVTLTGRVLTSKCRRSFHRRGFAVVEVSVADATGRVFAVWFNQAYLEKMFKPGKKVLLHGKLELYKDRVQMASPDFEVLDDDQVASGNPGIVPLYSLPDGLSQKLFRRMMTAVLDKHLSSAVETLPYDIRNRRGLLNIAKSLRQIHFPDNEKNRLEAYQRLSFEEFFLYQIPLILRKLKRREKQGIAFKIDEDLVSGFIGSLPFKLTDSQNFVVREIKSDMGAPRPMQRLLQGDVGSGKTIVATVAALIAAGNGYQTAFMVPTEILAQQHHEKLEKQFLSFRPSLITLHSSKIKVGLLTSSLDEKEKKEVLEKVKKGEIDILIGTHALIQEGVAFKKLGLIIIDEQHKFGVSQRSLLPQKGPNPDILIMTATPIPRTLSLTLFGDLDISVISELPRGRKKIETKAYPHEKRSEVFDFIRDQVAKGRQAFVVSPIIEENPKLELRSAKALFAEFSKEIFKDLKVGLLHGRMKQADQEKVMHKFRDGSINILVATTILEVGIDVPNATVMVIEHAERFGLSQLHQMRGRIGRAEHASFCFLISDPVTEDAQARIKVFVENADGFRIAEEDLKIRGPGEFFGERQHGLTELRIANPLTQMHLLKSAREEVVRLLKDDIKLEKRPNQEIKKQLHKRFPEFEKFIEVG